MYGNELEGIYLDVRRDGIYLILDNKKHRNPAFAKNPTKILEDTGIENYDSESLINAFKNKSERVEAKISNSTSLKIKDETLTVEISKDFMEAKVCFNDYHWLGKRMNLESIIQAIAAQGVVYGVMTDVLANNLAVSRTPGIPTLIAAGKPSRNGTNGFIKYNFDYSARNNKPKILEDGRVDYKDTNYILQIKRGETLAEAVDPSQGEDGMNVRGQTLPHKPGKPAPRLPRGKNTSLSENEKILIADVDGQIILENGRINVLPILNVPGNVGHETGNIDFIGSVFVAGSVQSDFSIRATGDVEVKGTVDGAVINAGGNVNLIGGLKGVGKAVVSAGGDIFVRYAERATLIADGDIIGDSIMHSEIKCKGHVKIEGKKGLLVGGVIYAGKSVTAKIIGSNMATLTELTVGHSPDFIIRYNELEELYKQKKEEYDNERLLDNFKTTNEDMRLRSLHARIHMRVELDNITKEMNNLLLVLNSREGVIRASQVIHSGCKIIVGGVSMHVKDDIFACTLRNVDGKVSVGTYVAYS